MYARIVRAPFQFALAAALAASGMAGSGRGAAAASPPARQAAGAAAGNSAASPAALGKLVKEAQEKNPQVLAALRAWEAARQAPSQVSTLPDPEFMVEHMTAGSPAPFSDFNTVPMTYLAMGVAQEFPYPGKLRLRGQVAGREAAALQERVETVRRALGAQVKAAYYRLAYVQETLGILARDNALLGQIEKIAEARYRVGQSSQQDVLKAQLQQTKLLRDLTEYRRERSTLEARLKELVNRPPDSEDITAAELTETPLPFTSGELLSMVRAGNPALSAQQEMVRSRSLSVELARKDFYPDFRLQYMWQRTGAPFPDRYGLSFGIRIPIYRRRRQEPELAQAAEELSESRREYDAEAEQAYFEVQDHYLAADADSKVLKIYREGLIPQATATFQAGLAAYQSGQLDFQTLLDSFLDVLNLDTEYWRTLAEHETALAQIEQLTGAALP